MSPILSGETDNIAINRSFVLSENMLPGDAVVTQPVTADGSIVNLSGYMKMSLRINVKYKTECSRCLRPLDETLILVFDKTIAVAGSLENEESDEVIEDYILIRENKLNLSQITGEQLLLDFPLRHLCSEDCRGLCPKCGHDLNEGDCGCNTAETDPRLRILQTLLDKKDAQNSEIDD
jgi:uncharacterized protein